LDVYVWSRPSIAESATILSKLVAERYWVVFWARCESTYEGRGASKASMGDRLVIVKPDRSVIVHGPKGFKPQNWQPDTSMIGFSVDGGRLIARFTRKALKEVLVLYCDEVYLITASKGAVEGEFYMYVSEEDIRDVLRENPDILEEGFRVVGVEKPIEPGFVDLYGVDSKGRLVVIELKRVKAGEDAVRQLLRYIEYFRRRRSDVRGILVAPAITENAYRMLKEHGLEFKRVDLRRIYELLKSGRKSRSLVEGLR